VTFPAPIIVEHRAPQGGFVSEQRKHSRKAVQAAIAFQAKDGTRRDGMCSNMSIGGMFIETLFVASFGEEITVFMKLPGLKQEVAVKAVVRWTEPEGMGVQFGTMGARETYALTQLIASSAKG
jgi:Tfp pilus assembly protein PilZ